MTASSDTPVQNDRGTFELMDNAAYDKDSDKSPKEVRIPLQTRLTETNAVPAANIGSCAHSNNGACRSMRASRAVPPHSSAGACYQNYNKILIVFLLLFIIWIIVYTVLSEMDML